MGTALIKIKIMPTSPETNLEEIKNKAKLKITEKKGENCNFEEQPIAFGLKAVIAGFALDEKYELESIEEELKKIENVNSVEVIDMRRAFG
jgi:elongation factor 1-beta